MPKFMIFLTNKYLSFQIQAFKQILGYWRFTNRKYFQYLNSSKHL